jgi:uncharacterized membrane protein YeaQ/YmgE (transglycosylase-associated protein family)
MGFGLVLLIVGLLLAFWFLGVAVSILYYLLVGLVVGGLGRLVLPGREKIGLLGTILIGLGGGAIGGVLGNALGVGSVLELVFSVAAAALLLTLFGFRSR